LSNVRVDISPAIPTRKHDISSWEEPDISRLSSRAKKRYYKRKSVIKDYFMTEDPVDEITLRYHFSPEILLKLAEQCLMQHEDGAPWGFRALLPGVIVTNHSSLSLSSEQETRKDKALKHPRQEPPAEVPDSVSGEPCQKLSQNKLIRDDETTAKYNAIKISPTTEHVETISPASLNNKDKHNEIIDEEMGTAVVDIEDVIIEAGPADVSDDIVIIAAEEGVSSPIAPIPGKS
jgi:hypothetical protein